MDNKYPNELFPAQRQLVEFRVRIEETNERLLGENGKLGEWKQKDSGKLCF